MSVTWEGAYSSYDEIKKEGFSEYHIVAALDSCEEVIRYSNKDDTNNRWQTLKDNLSKYSDKTNRVLEIAGGRGNAWVVAKEICDLEYHIVEIEQLVEHGRIIFPQINWYTEVPTLENGVDILYTRASLQYFEDIDKYLSDCICKTSPKKIIIEHQAFTPRETFWTHQKYLGKNLAWCFKNFKEFDSNIKQHGYELIYEYNDEYNYGTRIKFPKENVYHYMKNLVYEKL